ncbi:MAG: hypothetical protein ACYSWO_00815 [Planctomycetota bacterium]
MTGKYVRKGFVAMLVCLCLIGNAVHGTVLCFGADGHVEFESVFHEQCTDHVHSLPSDHHHHPSEEDHEHSKHCHAGQCVDVPVSMSMAKISQTKEKPTRASAAPSTDTIATVQQVDSCEHVPTLHAFLASCFFAPLRTVILVV